MENNIIVYLRTRIIYNDYVLISHRSLFEVNRSLTFIMRVKYMSALSYP